MALRLSVEDGILCFHSDRYFLSLFGRRLPLPGWLSPGRMTIAHEDLGGGGFAFTLDLTHPRAGNLIRQVIHFADPANPRPSEEP